jgi:hypothetical protein
MTTLELDQRTAEQLSALAAANGMTVDAYVKTLLPTPSNGAHPRMTLEELDQLFSENAFDGPTLPADFSRADIYGTHD